MSIVGKDEDLNMDAPDFLGADPSIRITIARAADVPVFFIAARVSSISSMASSFCLEYYASP